MSVDMIFLIVCLPEIPNPENALRELFRVLRPGRYLSTSEMLFDPDYPFMKTEKRWVANVGFELYREYSGLLSYQIVWKRPVM
jgi:ubiquinone/menaquinone biosynthesis C-methylase UbiE